MTHRNYTVAFDGTDVVAAFGAILSKFAEDPPEPKVHTVDIPAGADIDITEALGPVAFHNGHHRFTLALTGEEDDILARMRRLMALVHGKRANYRLSWDEGYTYTGRWVVTGIERVADHLMIVELDVDRYPWKVGDTESIELNAHPTDSATLEGSERYSNITVKGKAPATVVVNGLTVEIPAGTTVVAGQAMGDTPITITVDDWVCYLDGTNLVVNTAYYQLVGEDAQFSDEKFALVDTDLRSADEANQHFTLSYTRKDL